MHDFSSLKMKKDKKNNALQYLDDNYARRPHAARLLGIDFGMQKMGVAVCGPDQAYASPAATIVRKNFTQDSQELLKLINDYDAKGIVFGWPLNMDGTEGPMCDRVRSFIDEIMNISEIAGKIEWVAIFDERLSTQSVEEFLVRDVDMSRTKREKVVDKLAAQKILDRALHRIKVLQAQE